MEAESEGLETSRRIIERCIPVLARTLRNSPTECAGYVSIELTRGDLCESWVLRNDGAPVERAAFPKEVDPVLRIQADEALLIEALKRGREPRDVMLSSQMLLTGRAEMLRYVVENSAALVARLAATSRKDA